MQELMGSSCCHTVLALLLLLLNFERTKTAQASCSSCEPGTFCDKDNPKCIPCPPGTYSSVGGQHTCNICTKCEGYFKIQKPCSSTSNTQCDCIEGYHCVGSECAHCKKDCTPGQESTSTGCKDCQSGMFNDQQGRGFCRPWTNCSLDGKSVLVSGTKDSDVVCGPAAPVFSPEERSPKVLTFFLALTTATLLFLLFFLMIRLSVVRWRGKKFLYMLKQPFTRPMRTAQQEDACSCRFPEEEEGGREP